MTDTPKLWRDMTPEEKGALLLAHHEGKVIETCCPGTFRKEWLSCDPQWREDFAYRVRPDPSAPKVETVVQYWDRERNNSHFIERIGDTHRITFNLIDSEPDCASVKMERIA